MATVSQFFEKLREIPPDWRISATKSGRSIQVWEPGGTRYALVFTDDQPTRWLTNRTGWRNSE